MIERLLIPAWDTPPRSLDDWRAALERLGHRPDLEREGSDEVWLVLGPIGARLFVVLEGERLTALHAEIEAPEPAPALSLLDEAAGQLGWEVHDEEDDEDDEDRSG